MASSMVGTRLREEIIEQLQKRAEAEGKKVSDLVRELIIEGLAKTKQTGRDAGAGIAGREIVSRLDLLNERVGKVLQKKGTTEGPPILRTALGLDEMEKRLTTLLVKAIKAGAASQFYARTGALETIDLVSIWSAQIETPDNTEARKEVAGRLDTDSHEFADWWLKQGLINCYNHRLLGT